MTYGFETALVGQSRSEVVYATEPGAELSVSVSFEDENGVRWQRVDNGDPVQLRE